jgi:hypothetical protein
MSETSQNRRPMRVEKSQTSVVILTQWCRIEGKIHVIPGSRITDFMNSSTGQTFIPITEARVYPLSGETPLYSADFLDVNKNYIIVIIPQPKLVGEPL